MTLPEPSHDFHWTQEPWGPALRSRALSSVVPHLFTSRTLDLTGEGPGGAAAWVHVAGSLGVAPDRLVRLRQVHGATVVDATETSGRGGRAHESMEPWPEGDACMSRSRGLALSVRVADCTPTLLADPSTGAVAAIHAGWRGTAAGAVGATVAALARHHGVVPSHLVAAVGPSIGPCCYEVGRELVEAFASHAGSRAWFIERDRLHLDLWRATVDQLTDAGVPSARIQVARLCTACHTDVFSSYRKEGRRAGRMVAAITAQPAG